MKKSELTTEIPVKDRHGNVVGQKTVVRFSGLLAKAHEEGLRKITTKLVQAPTKENGNLAVVHAVVETKQGSYEGLGDASPANVSGFLSTHLIRMAETRAKARALRDATNIGTVSLEELVSDIEEDGIVESTPPGNGGNGGKKAEAQMTTAQRRYLFRLLAQKGLEGDKAKGSLLKAFDVQDLAQVSKKGASRMIDMIQKDQAQDLFTAEA